jgi:DNA (cytosine-5)-methyltransferase 1
LVGNAINVEVAQWIGERLATRVPVDLEADNELAADAPWPVAAWFDGTKRYCASLGTWPVSRPAEPLETFLRFPGQPLSLRATRGFHKRILASSLRFKAGFVNAIGLHAARMEGAAIGTPTSEPLPDAA